MKTLAQVQDKLDSIYAINWGGCGISALAMYRWLYNNDMLAGDEHFVYLYVSHDHNFGINDKLLKSKRTKNKIGSCSHIMLFHNGKVHDSRGCKIRDHYVYKHDNITEKQLIHALNHGDWNDDFDREEQMPKIERMLEVDLSDITYYC